jgi:hypothetical protein
LPDIRRTNEKPSGIEAYNLMPKGLL